MQTAALGICAALLDRQQHGRGSVIDAAMANGVPAMLMPLLSMQAHGHWSKGRGENMLNGGAPWYGVYRTAAARHLAVGAIESAFRREK
jgi:alpha-methylacyl-CoA racemase